jgi:hypothetical protein
MLKNLRNTGKQLVNSLPSRPVYRLNLEREINLGANRGGMEIAV